MVQVVYDLFLFFLPHKRRFFVEGGPTTVQSDHGDIERFPLVLINSSRSTGKTAVYNRILKNTGFFPTYQSNCVVAIAVLYCQSLAFSQKRIR